MSESDHGVGFKIGALWAFVAVHDDGDEGIIGVLGPRGWVPAVAADQERLDLLRPQMREIARNFPREIKLVKFHQREDVETIGGSE